LPSLDAGPLGQPMTRFRTPAKDVLDMEIGTIVGRSFAAKGEIEPSDLPAGRAAHFHSSSPASTRKSTCPGRASIPPSSKRIFTRCLRDLGSFGARQARQPWQAWQPRQAR
jgi:hypothetical protein